MFRQKKLIPDLSDTREIWLPVSVDQIRALEFFLAHEYLPYNSVGERIRALLETANSYIESLTPDEGNSVSVKTGHS